MGLLTVRLLLALLLLAALPSCASRSREGPPDADGGLRGWTSPLPDGGRWYAPTWGASRLRARSLGMGTP